MSEPSKVIDPHIHLWDLWTRIYPRFERPSKLPSGSNAAIARSYLLEEFLDEGEGEVEVVGAVHVEASPTDPVKETETLQEVADRSPIPLVIVSNGDLTSPDLPALLDRHAEFGIFGGIRQVVNWHKNPGLSYTTRDLLAESHFLTGLKELGRQPLLRSPALSPPDGRHFHPARSRSAHIPVWLSPNIAMKISGLGMLDAKWTLESIRPLVLEALEAFGLERAMFASNFPVDSLTSDYRTLWRAFSEITRGFSADERMALLSANAQKFYRIG